MATKTTQETTRTIDQASGAEARLQALFEQLAQQAGRDLQAGPQGVGEPTAADQALIEQSIGASGDIAQRQLSQQMEQIMAQLSESLAARGVQGSSIESMMAGQIGSQGLQDIANMLSQQQAQGAQALMNLPFQRAQVEMGQNQQLLQQLTGTGNPLLQGGLQERLNTINSKNTTTQSGMSAADMAKVGMMIANPAAGIGQQLFSGLFGGGQGAQAQAQIAGNSMGNPYGFGPSGSGM